MLILRDRWGTTVRVTDERLAHVARRLEMAGQEDAIAETLLDPHWVFQSSHDQNVRLYYRRYSDSPVGDKLLCAVIRWASEDSFLLTAFFTSRIKRGLQIWPEGRS